MQDETESIRKTMVAINTAQVQSNDPVAERARLEAIHGVGNVFDTDEVRAKFEVQGFMAPFVSVKKLDTGERGALEFQHSPRFYFGWSKL